MRHAQVLSKYNIRDYIITRSTIIELFFLRHGIAEDQPSKGNRDADRALTKEGIDSMQISARGMLRLGLQLDHLVSSPLTRAIQTAEIVGKQLALRPRVEAALAPGFDIAQLRRLLSHYSSTQRVMFVGHEPDLSMLIAALTDGGQVLMKKGGLALISVPHNTPFDGTLRYLLPPKVLRALGE